MILHGIETMNVHIDDIDHVGLSCSRIGGEASCGGSTSHFLKGTAHSTVDGVLDVLLGIVAAGGGAASARSSQAATVVLPSGAIDAHDGGHLGSLPKKSAPQPLEAKRPQQDCNASQ